MPIPSFNTDGELPSGEHEASIKEISKVFGRKNNRRIFLMEGLNKAIGNLFKAGVGKIWVNGSFITSKEEPNDIDGCWEYTSKVDLEKIDPVFLFKTRQPMKKKYGVEFFPAFLTEGMSGLLFPDFFQTNREGNPKGIIVIKKRG